MSDNALRIYIVEVSCDVDFEDLDPRDQNDDGNCAVDGSYRIGLRDVPAGTSSADVTESVLDIFHDKIGIACLDDFSIIMRGAGSNDDETSLRHDLGDFGWKAPLAHDGPEP